MIAAVLTSLTSWVIVTPNTLFLGCGAANAWCYLAGRRLDGGTVFSAAIVGQCLVTGEWTDADGVVYVLQGQSDLHDAGVRRAIERGLSELGVPHEHARLSAFRPEAADPRLVEKYSNASTNFASRGPCASR